MDQVQTDRLAEIIIEIASLMRSYTDDRYNAIEKGVIKRKMDALSSERSKILSGEVEKCRA
jgi:hypothetical protein